MTLVTLHKIVKGNSVRLASHPGGGGGEGGGVRIAITVSKWGKVSQAPYETPLSTNHG